jgi:hypothetical protein
MASANVHATAVPYPAVSNQPQRSRAARSGPRVTTAIASTTANGVPGPACGNHSPNSGAAPVYSGTPLARSTAPTTAAAATNPSAAAPAQPYARAGRISRAPEPADAVAVRLGGDRSEGARVGAPG